MVKEGYFRFEQVKNGGHIVDLAGKQLGDQGAKQLAKALMDPTTTVQELLPTTPFNVRASQGSKDEPKITRDVSWLQLYWEGRCRGDRQGSRNEPAIANAKQQWE